MDLELGGMTAMVLGASRGIGRAVAGSLAREGATVVVCGRDEVALERAVKEIGVAGGKAHALPADLSTPGAGQALADGARELAGRIDILVNNGGGPPPGPISEVPAEQWARSFQEMAISLFELTAALLPEMRARRFGRVITVGSSTVVEPISNLGISNTIRAAVAGWSKTLASEVAADGVTVNMVLPGVIDTERARRIDVMRAELSGISPDDARRGHEDEVPAGRYGSPEEFGNVVAFLASPLASYITGSMLRVDGGLIRSV